MNLSISDLPNLQALLLLAESPAVKLELEKLIKRAETSSQDSPPAPPPGPRPRLSSCLSPFPSPVPPPTVENHRHFRLHPNHNVSL